MRHIVLLRFSAIGDVTIAAPLVRAYATANPDIRFTMVSQAFLRPLFENIPNLDFFPIDFSGENHNYKAVIRTAKEIYKLHPTDIVDLHDVIRTKFIRSYLSLRGIPCFSIKKDRAKREVFIVRKGRDAMIPTMQRYENVLVAAGLKNLHFTEKPVPTKNPDKYVFHRIGIAPFAKHEGKSWPIDKMEEVVATLSKDPNTKIYLFGDKKKEAAILQKWQDKYSDCESIAGKYTLAEELELIRSLDLMISMDSANMHFASYVNTPVISIWGATHPNAGFYGWGQAPGNAIGIDLKCRPCSIYGNKKCERFDYACLNMITPQMVLDKISSFFGE